jgi:hypothetical protein
MKNAWSKLQKQNYFVDYLEDAKLKGERKSEKYTRKFGEETLRKETI